MLRQLLDVWPVAVPGLHRLSLEDGAVQLLLAVGGSVRQWLPQLCVRVDAFFVDAGSLASEDDPTWPLRLFKAAGRLATPNATLVMPAAGAAARAALRTAGFALSRPASGVLDDGATADTWCARYAPGFAPRRTIGAQVAAAPSPDERHALIVGAGLAGCAAAWALAEQGWTSTLFDHHDAPAREASGNPGGLFHGVVHAQDGIHARVHRAAALEARRAVQWAIEHHGVAGSTDGLLRIEAAPAALRDGEMRATLRAILHASQLPPEYVRVIDADEASRLAGVPIAHPCWYYPGGGWVQPAGLARSFIERGGARVHFCAGTPVARLRCCASKPGDAHGNGAPGQARALGGGPVRWQLIDPADRVLGESAVVVLANAGSAAPLLTGSLSSDIASQPRTPAGTCPERVRGQLSMLSVADIADGLPGLVLPRIPLVGAGWLLPIVNGQAVFGATAQANDADPAVRASDHALNLAALARLTGLPLRAVPPTLEGRTAWRCVAPDRLPLIGPLPYDDLPLAGAVDLAGAHSSDTAVDAVAGRREPIARLPGVYTFSALGSRGITWSALGAQVLASWIAGSPMPVARDLVNALDPGRFVLRQRRRKPAEAHR